MVCPDLDLVVVPGHHLSLLDTPNAEVIAGHLDNVLATLRKPAVARDRGAVLIGRGSDAAPWRFTPVRGRCFTSG